MHVRDLPGAQPRVDWDAFRALYPPSAVFRRFGYTDLVEGQHVCPFHPDSSPSLNVTATYAKCYSPACPLSGTTERPYFTASDLAAYLSGLPAPQAACIVDDACHCTKPAGGPVVLSERIRARVNKMNAERARTSEPKKLDPETEPIADPVVQEWLSQVIFRAADDIWYAPIAIDYLYSRGLDYTTIRWYRLGYCYEYLESPPLERYQGGKIRIPAQSILIPWLWPDSHWIDSRLRWACVQTRYLPTPKAPEPPQGRAKYTQIKGSRRVIYPTPSIRPECPTLIVEGAFDALLAWQSVGHLVNVASFGSCSGPYQDFLDLIEASHPWIVAFDGDAPGRKGAEWFRSRYPDRVQLLDLPEGLDVADFIQRGWDFEGVIQDCIESD